MLHLDRLGSEMVLFFPHTSGCLKRSREEGENSHQLSTLAKKSPSQS